MENPQVAKQIALLMDKASFVRQIAAEALGLIGDASAVPSLIEAFKYGYRYVRWTAATALGRIGDIAAVSVLIDALEDEDNAVRWCAANALRQIGNSDTLPCKILLDSRFSPHKRINFLERLRHVRYNKRGILLYTFPLRNTGRNCL